MQFLFGGRVSSKNDALRTPLSHLPSKFRKNHAVQHIRVDCVQPPSHFPANDRFRHLVCSFHFGVCMNHKSISRDPKNTISNTLLMPLIVRNKFYIKNSE